MAKLIRVLACTQCGAMFTGGRVAREYQSGRPLYCGIGKGGGGPGDLGSTCMGVITVLGYLSLDEHRPLAPEERPLAPGEVRGSPR